MTVASPIFKGDSAGHLDLLVEVCNSKKPAPEAPLIERTLQPFDWTDAAPMPSSSKAQGRSPRASPPKAKSAKHARLNAPSPASKASGAASPVKARPPVSVSGRVSLDGLPRSPSTPLGSSSKFLSFDGVSREAIMKVAALNRPVMPSCGLRACPGFFSSPRPCDIPQPTSGLLMRALSVKA